MNYYLFSAVQRCQPCKLLVQALDKDFPDWKNYIEYVHVDEATEKQITLISKLGIRTIPSFTDESEILIKGFAPKTTVNVIKKLCIKE